MGTLRGWWRKLAGGGPVVPARVPRPVVGQAARAEDLKLADGPEPKRPGHVGAAGFDPYSSDAGYSKPHCWERVDHD
jgi:hypothetical protein